MTTKDKENLIGYDPLAWMHKEQTSGDEPSVLAQEEAPENAVDEAIIEEPLIIAESIDNETQENEEGSAWVDALDENEEGSNIVLGATLNIQTVTDLQAKLISVLENHPNIEIDASAVSFIDTASLQLLVILKQEAIKLNKDLTFDFPSDRFIEAAELLGVDDLLGVDQAAAGFF